jgi:putative heme iron utilization protein
MDGETSALLDSLVKKERIAHLATLRGGAPMASMTLYLPSEDFSAFYVHVSRLAWHTQDMQHDPRVALSISETDDEALNLKEDLSMKERWLARFPEQAINFQLADFSFWKITPRDARFVAGFGRIHNLSAAELARSAQA